MTTANPKEDKFGLDEILAKSKNLVTSRHAGISVISGKRESFKRGFSELNACGSATTVGVDDEIALTAACLLSAKGIDIISVSKDVFGLKVEDSHESNEEQISTDFHGYLNHRNDIIVYAAIDKAKETSEELVRKSQQRWMTDDWRQSRKAFYDHLERHKISGHPPKSPLAIGSNVLPKTPSTVSIPAGETSTAVVLSIQPPEAREMRVHELLQLLGGVVSAQATRSLFNTMTGVKGSGDAYRSELFHKSAEMLQLWAQGSYPQDSNGSQDAVMKALQLLLNLMLFSNLASDRSWSDALEVLDQIKYDNDNPFIPSTLDIVAECAAQLIEFDTLYPVLTCLDDLLLEVAECIVQEHGVLMARYDGSLPSGRWGLGALGGSGGADEEAHVDKLRGRSEALLSFTERVRSRLRRADTITYIAEHRRNLM